MTQKFKWQDVTIIFDNEDFQVGFERGREYYFHGRLDKFDEAGAPIVEASDVLHVVTMPDGHGGYQFDKHMGIETSLAELIGVLAGFFSGLSCPETSMERQGILGQGCLDVG